MGAKSSVEAAKLNSENWGHIEVCDVNLKKSVNYIIVLSSLRIFFVDSK